MFYTHSLEGWREAQWIEERNERPLLVALVAVVAAWSVAFLIALA
jgi:hypothetical protein